MASFATRFVIGLVTVWILFYLGVYYMLMSPAGDTDDVEPDRSIVGGDVAATPGPGSNKVAVGHTGVGGSPFHLDTFVSSTCQSRHFDAKGFTATVIIVARNEKKENLLNTVSCNCGHALNTSLVLCSQVSSVNSYSSTMLKNIVIVDDMSLYPVRYSGARNLSCSIVMSSYLGCTVFSSWPEWAHVSNVHIERTQFRVGVAAAKALGANYAVASDKPSDKFQHMLVFLDAHSVVGENWLTPLAATIRSHPNSGWCGMLPSWTTMI
jgi:hypothetical protein